MLPWQSAISDLPDRVWDVAVVGAGPAGAVAAARLARAGRDVLVLDRARFPRDKVCGDALIPDAIAALDRLGALEAVRARGEQVARTAVFSPSRIAFEVPGRFITLKRLHLDALLAEHAAARGATIAHASVARVEPAADGVVLALAGVPHAVRAKVAIVATGAAAAAVPAAHPGSSGPHAVALRCYVQSDARIDRLVISYDHAVLPGYAWIFPLGGGEYNVGCGMLLRGRRDRVNLRQTFRRFVAEFPLARDLMAASRATTPLKGATLRCGLSGVPPAPAPNVLAIGESIGTTFPFTGEGIGKAMESGEMAADAADAALGGGGRAALAGFAARVATLQPKYLGYRIAEKWLAWPWVVDLLARRAGRSGYLRDALAGILDETVDPRTVFSPIGVARWFVR